MSKKHHQCQGLLCIGIALFLASPAAAGWGSSYGSGGSFGSYGSGGSTGSSHGSYGGSHGSRGGLFGHMFAKHRSSLGSSGGSSGISYSSWGGSSGGSWGGSWGGSSGGRSGLFHGGLINKLRAHHQKKMSWLRSKGSRGSSGGSWGSSHGSSGGSWGGSHGGSSHGSSGGSWGGSHGGSSHGSSGGSWVSSGTVVEPTTSTPIYSEPVYADSTVYSDPVYAEPSNDVGQTYDGGHPVESTPAEGYDSGYSTEGGVLDGSGIDAGGSEITPMPLNGASTSTDKGALIVSLPAKAKLFVNGQQTTSKGSKRQFVSKGLKTGYRYPYELKAVMDVDGKQVVKTKRVNLRAGDSNQIAFDFDQTVATNLTVHVPKDARLELAGSTTKTTGAERTFITKKLSAGQVWKDYRVVVSVKQNGRTITKEQTIDLRGGEQRTLTFDFDSEQVASR